MSCTVCVQWSCVMASVDKEKLGAVDYIYVSTRSLQTLTKWKWDNYTKHLNLPKLKCYHNERYSHELRKNNLIKLTLVMHA